ncbi:hypothetical protein ACFYZJ_09905 [Streptomyces sp. NPDC001848]|uniref:hypothetical protein n=1 Tax=Streptomyces sp. NPDC001848 TaxID=3364618 RepID=UPI0036C69A78
MARTAAATPREATRKQPAETHAHEGGGLHLHTRTVHPSLRIPYITRDDLTSTAREATSRMPGVPSGKDLVFYGGLTAMAVAGALEWPVALAVGGATWLVRSSRTRERGAETAAGHNGGSGASARRTA